MSQSVSKSLFGFLSFILKNEYEQMFFSRNIIRMIQTTRVITSHNSAEDRRQYRLLLVGKLLNYGENCFAFLRMLLLSYVQYHWSLTDYLPYDPVSVSIVLNFSFFAFPFTVASFSLAVNIFFCLVDYYITFCVDEQMLALAYLVSVDSSCRRYLLSKVCAPLTSRSSLNRLLREPLASARRWAAQMGSFWSGKSPLLPCANAPCTPQFNVLAREWQLPRLGAQTRTRATLFSFALEMGGFLILAGIAIFLIESLFLWPELILNSYSAQQLKTLSRLQRFILKVHAPVEVLFSHYTFYRFFNNFIFLVQSLLLLVFIVRQHANDCNRLLEGIFLRRCPPGRSRRRGALIERQIPLPPPSVTTTIISLFMREHSRLVSTVDHLDRRFAAHLVFAAFLTTFPLNVHLIAQMMTDDEVSSSFRQRFLLSASILNHWSFMLYFGLASSAIINYLSSSAPLLQRLQVRLLKDVERGCGGAEGNTWQMLFTRLKLAHYYQLVHSTSKRKSGIHFGHLSLITRKTFVDFLFFYTSVLMYVFKDRS